MDNQLGLIALWATYLLVLGIGLWSKYRKDDDDE